MCTDRRGLLVWIALAICLAQDAQAAAVRVILVVDGICLDRFERVGPWGDRVMPEATSWIERGAVVRDAWSSTTNSEEGTRRILSRLEETPAAQRWWIDGVRSRNFSVGDGWQRIPPTAIETLPGPLLAEQEARLFAAIEAAAAESLDVDIVAAFDHLRPPWPSNSTLLQRFDPAPWRADSGTLETMERILARRLKRARELSDEPWAQARRSERNRDEVAWLLDVAHARLDQLLGRLAERLGEEDLRDRAQFMLTASHSTSEGEAGRWGQDALGSPRVPLLLAGSVTQAETRSGLPRASRLAGTGTDTWGLRVETEDWVLVEDIRPIPRLRLFDPRTDPGLLFERGAAHPAVRDSLAAEAHRLALGHDAVLELHCPAGVQIVLRSTRPMVGDEGNSMRWDVVGPAKITLAPIDRWGTLSVEGTATICFGESAPRELVAEERLAPFGRAFAETWVRGRPPIDDAMVNLRIVLGREALLDPISR